MKTTSIKVSEATNVQLDWLMAECLGLLCPNGKIKDTFLDSLRSDEDELWSGSPALMGSIIEQFPSYYLKKWAEMRPVARYQFHLWDGDADHVAFGPTPMVAMARCYITSKRGESAEIPIELATTTPMDSQDPSVVDEETSDPVPGQ